DAFILLAGYAGGHVAPDIGDAPDRTVEQADWGGGLAHGELPGRDPEYSVRHGSSSSDSPAMARAIADGRSSASMQGPASVAARPCSQAAAAAASKAGSSCDSR